MAKDNTSVSNHTQIYRNLSLYVADYISLNFATPFDLTNITEKTCTFEEFVKETGNDMYTSQYQSYNLSFLSCMSKDILVTLNNHMLGIFEETQTNKEGESILTFGQNFVGSQLSESILNSISQNFNCNFIKSGEKLNLFRLFFNDDKVLSYSLDCKINEKDVGKICFCHIEDFFDQTFKSKELESQNKNQSKDQDNKKEKSEEKEKNV